MFIQNKISGRCMWDGDPVYCQKCQIETSSTFNLPDGKSVCESCAADYEADANHTPSSCSNCGSTPSLLVSVEEKLLCSDCHHTSPADIFDFMTKPYGGRLDLPSTIRPDEELTAGELNTRKFIRSLFSSMDVCGVQPLTGPSGLISTIRDRYRKP